MIIQDLADLAVSVNAILLRKSDDSHKLIINILLVCLITQGAAGNFKNLTCPSLGGSELLLCLNDRTA